MLARYHIKVYDVSANPSISFGLFWTIAVNILRFSSLLHLPFCILNHISLLLYNLFDSIVSLDYSNTASKPFICLRIATKGDYPLLVRKNVHFNMEICRRVGLEKFLIEVVTSKRVGLENSPMIRELVIPSKYRTKNGTLFKARGLQYCLESGVNILDDNDWIASKKL
uniref:Uncharacterized protein n=1 Tax=Romanomermis culicivorax TaxID=13658 RepID=A0A915LA76_ROMCU